MYTLAQPQKLYTNEVFNFWKANTPPLKASLFLSFHIVQKMKSGMDFHTFFLFLPTKEPFQLLRTSFTEFGNTHCTPHNARMISHNPFATVQWIKIWLIVSSSHPHKKHRLGNCHPLLCSLSKVRTFPQVAFQAKKAIWFVLCFTTTAIEDQKLVGNRAFMCKFRDTIKDKARFYDEVGEKNYVYLNHIYL